MRGDRGGLRSGRIWRGVFAFGLEGILRSEHAFLKLMMQMDCCAKKGILIGCSFRSVHARLLVYDKAFSLRVPLARLITDGDPFAKEALQSATRACFPK